jgi:hypothetical protein
MTRHKVDPLRALTGEEREVLTQISRAASAPASHVARARALLAVADGQNYTEAAQAAGRRAGDAGGNDGKESEDRLRAFHGVSPRMR